MFERRLKVFLCVLLVMTLVLLLRAGQIQVVQKRYWTEEAAGTTRRYQDIETTRGRILDRKGREIAVDLACIDVAVDYRAITNEPNADWVRRFARQRISKRLGTEFTAASLDQRTVMLNQEIEQVKLDIDQMWFDLGRLSGQTIEAIDESRLAVINKVEMRRRYLWNVRYQRALAEYEDREAPSLWKRLLVDESRTAPQQDEFDDELYEQSQPHVIVKDVSAEAVNELGKHLDRYPGLVLQPGVHRVYPYNEVACHLLGRLSRVNREDLETDQFALSDDPAVELKRYWQNDVIGRQGIESLAEATLRGTRGRITRVLGKHDPVETVPAKPGADVAATIDIELQKQILAIFDRVNIRNADMTEREYPMHGAAVLLDVRTNEVIAMVSAPAFDLNKFDDLYPAMVKDDVNNQLLNRATQFAVVPGSTLKPVVGLTAIMNGLATVSDTIECTGFLVLNGVTYKGIGRCWTESMWPGMGHNHHQIPSSDPHPTGFLTFADAIQRSCNVYFETLADRLGYERMDEGLSRFGLGRVTGLGIPEVSGNLVSSKNIREGDRQANLWFSGIGQGHVAATPIQMANVAATIARRGVWMQPQLMRNAPPVKVDLHIPPSALDAAIDGMVRVVNTPAGSGTRIHRDDMLVAGKTGTAQAPRFTVPLRDEKGELLRDENGKVRYRFIQPSVGDALSPEAPWYRAFGDAGDKYNHSWMIGFAPADNPQIAFAVMVEYGGAGGWAAGSVAKEMLQLAIDHGYLQGRPTTTVTRSDMAN